MTGREDPSNGRSLLTASDYETLASFRRGVRRYLAFAEANARAAGLTSQQHQALLAVKARAGAMSIGELAAELLLKHHSAVELVGRLEKAGFTRRAADVHDRRKVIVSLTHAGEAVLTGLSVSNLRELRLIAPTLSGLLDQLDKLGPNASAPS